MSEQLNFAKLHLTVVTERWKLRTVEIFPR
jgi:hypothetical protein